MYVARKGDREEEAGVMTTASFLGAKVWQEFLALDR